MRSRLILLFLLCVPLYFFGNFAWFSLSPDREGSGQPVVVEIHKAEPAAEISKTLVAQGAVTDARMFMWLGRITRQWKKIKAGEYEVNSGMTPLEIFSVLTSGVSIAHPVTVREGENMYEVAADIESKNLATRATLIKLCKSPQFIMSLGFLKPMPLTLEGYLFPDTYFLNKSMSPEEMLRPMVKHFMSIWGEREDARARELGMSRHEAVTLASIIEKETGAPQERPLISSVFHNRLKKHMRLQSDPTTIYGMWDRYRGKIHHSDLLEPSPYNTYTVAALPAGPVSNPGREAIEAALHPATSDFLFFVSHNDGTHEFTRTYEQHTRAVKRFQLDPAMREGKSWRDLKRKSP